jgi:selenocysteine lyase/cysteine desulfurase
MGNTRRHFLRTISGVAALPAIGSVLITEPRTGLGAASSGDVRAQFPLLGDSMNGHPLVYLDSAATTQRPRAVLDTLDTFYLHENANPSTSLHALARHSASLYDESRATVARFLNARGSDEIVFTRGTTEAINLVARPGVARTSVAATKF